VTPPTVDRRAAAEAIDAFLRALGRNEHELVGTGARVAAMFADELCAGYAVDTRKLVTDAVIDAGSQSHAAGGSLVVVRDIAVATMCPHHLLPALGTATVGFKVTTRLIGIGDVVALVDAHARRLTLQEDIGAGVVGDLDAVLSPEWVGCRLTLSHGCMTARGERAAGTSVETLALRGPPDRVAEAHVVLGVGQGGAR
jgi:GTP cyclohydrolase I